MALVRLLADTYVRESEPRRGSAPKRVRWTLARVAELMEAEFGISYSMAHVRTILAGLVGDDQWLLSKPRFWSCVVELAYPEYKRKVLVEEFEDGWEVDLKILLELRQRLRS